MAEIKDKKAMINDGKNIELEGVIVINEGISLSETLPEETKENDASVETAENTVTNTQDFTVPEFPTTEVPIAPVDLPITSDVQAELPNSPELGEMKLPDYARPVNETSVYPSYEVPEQSSSDFSTSGVYKSADDVDLAATAFLNESREAYYKNIVAPTKAVVSLVNDFVAWGNKVTTQGLNRSLFEEFDELIARYDGMEVAKYGDDNNYNKVTDINGFNSSYGNDSNNYGGMAA